MLFCILVSFFCEFFHRMPFFQCLGWRRFWIIKTRYLRFALIYSSIKEDYMPPTNYLDELTLVLRHYWQQ